MLFVPLIIRLDTVENIVDIRIRGIFHSWLSADQAGLVVHVWLPIYHFEIHPFQESATKSGSSEKKNGSRTPGRKQIRRVLNMIRSFRIDFIEVAVDTDDYVLNAQLVPIGQFLSSNNISLSVNFCGATFCKIQIQNTLWRLGLAFLKVKKY
ncbi:MAG: hypothetical protein ABJG78_03780 [Cyclobacteriaceae bacterium]